MEDKLGAVIVCGSRYGDGTPDGSVVARGLRLWMRTRPLRHVVVGSRSGVDGQAFAVLTTLGVPVTVVPAHWSLGDAAGPIRNRRMAQMFPIETVLAFPGGDGTADMVGVAQEMGIPTWLWREEWREPGWELHFTVQKNLQLSLPLLEAV